MPEIQNTECCSSCPQKDPGRKAADSLNGRNGFDSGEILIRFAKKQDIPTLARLLYQVHRVHSTIRPDLFRQESRKYSDAQLEDILQDPNKPVLVAEVNGKVGGYAFCVFQEHQNDASLTDIKTLYIDDICVDEAMRKHHLGRSLYQAAENLARSSGCYNVTLNVWQGNEGAKRFYEDCGMSVQKTGMERIL